MIKIKKLSSVILFMLFAVTCVISGALTVSAADDNVVVDSYSVIYGDVNDDGKVDIRDLVCMKKSLAGITTNFYIEASDCNGDGLYAKTDDLVVMRKYLLGTIEELH